MSTTKKTLVVKISHDVSQMDTITIELLKAAIKAQGIDNGLAEDQIDFDLLYSNEESRVLRMLRGAGLELKATDEEIKAAEKLDGYQEFLSLFSSLYGDDGEMVCDEE
jgi:hypothetical protein